MLRERKSIVSVALPRRLANALRKRRGYTIFIQKLIEKSEGRCPSCGHKLIDFPKETAP